MCYVVLYDFSYFHLQRFLCHFSQASRTSRKINFISLSIHHSTPLILFVLPFKLAPIYSSQIIVFLLKLFPSFCADCLSAPLYDLDRLQYKFASFIIFLSPFLLPFSDDDDDDDDDAEALAGCDYSYIQQYITQHTITYNHFSPYIFSCFIALQYVCTHSPLHNPF